MSGEIHGGGEKREMKSCFEDRTQRLPGRTDDEDGACCSPRPFCFSSFFLSISRSLLEEARERVLRVPIGGGCSSASFSFPPLTLSLTFFACLLAACLLACCGLARARHTRPAAEHLWCAPWRIPSLSSITSPPIKAVERHSITRYHCLLPAALLTCRLLCPILRYLSPMPTDAL